VRVLRCFSIAVAISLGATPATADPVVGETSIEVVVGATKSLDVGFARGLQCDDIEVVHAELRGVSPTSNRLFLTGARVGRTLCRAGTLGPPTVLVHVTVVAR
jgi:hypothetical protein